MSQLSQGIASIYLGNLFISWVANEVSSKSCPNVSSGELQMSSD